MNDWDREDGSATPLTFEQLQGLIPTQIATRADLNAVEQRNILKAAQKVRRGMKPQGIEDILTDTFICKLHKEMFADVWKWAGQYRKHDTNIGTNCLKIPMELRLLLGDTQYWLEHQVYPSYDEAILRFHHRLVLIHPFPNGNGRHARLMTDFLIEKLSDRRFTWGQVNLAKPGQARLSYIQALQAADRNDIQPLLKFARS